MRCALIWWAQSCMNQSNFCIYDVSSVHGFTCHLKLSLEPKCWSWLACCKVNFVSRNLEVFLFASRIYHLIWVVRSLGGHKSARTNQLFDLCRELRAWIHLLLEIISLGPGWLVSKLNLPQEIGKFWNSVTGLGSLVTCNNVMVLPKNLDLTCMWCAKTGKTIQLIKCVAKKLKLWWSKYTSMGFCVLHIGLQMKCSLTPQKDVFTVMHTFLFQKCEWRLH